MNDTPGVSTMVPPDEPIERDEAQELQVLGRDAILGYEDLVIEEVDVPEWNGKIYVRRMSGHERDAYESVNHLLHESMRYTDFRARLLVSSLCNAEGKLIFTDIDIQALSKKSAKPLDRLFDVATRLSGITDKNVEEMAKNSGGGQNGNSG